MFLPVASEARMSLPFRTERDLFDGLPEADARRIRSFLYERRFPRNATVVCEDGDADALIVVRKGLLKLVALSARGTEAIIHVLRPGDVFGETAVIGGTRPYSAVALTDAVVAVLPRRTLLDLLDTHAPFAKNFARMLAARLGEVEREFADALDAWAFHRLARELHHLAGDLGVETSRGTLIPLGLTHEDLARLIGTTRETVTLLLHRFEELGIVRREGRRILVNRPLLADYAGRAPAEEVGA